MLSKQSIDILIDLVEIKLSVMLVQDKDDEREFARLQHCRTELMHSKRDLLKNSNNPSELYMA